MAKKTSKEVKVAHASANKPIRIIWTGRKNRKSFKFKNKRELTKN